MNHRKQQTQSNKEDSKMTTTTKPVRFNKMNAASSLFALVTSPDYDRGEKTARQAFLERAEELAQLTARGASTYYQNLLNESQGKGAYRYNKTARQVGDVKEVVAVDQPRWMVVDGEGKEVSAFASRSAAQSEAKSTGMKWADRNKA